jgi:hypothetical protein
MSQIDVSYKSTIKRRLPPQIWELFRSFWYQVLRASQWPLATFHPWRRESIRHLRNLKNIHQGQRCFILGNGPSLKQTKLINLRDEYTFGMNRIYLLFPELGFTTTYFLSVNDLVIEQCAQEIRELTIPKFLSWRARSYLEPSDTITFLHTTYSGPKFARDARQRLWEGATVTYVALQLAYHMGFEKVILVGVDHNFKTKGKPNTAVVSQGADQDHFDDRYFGKGFRWQLPDLETSERAYQMARKAYSQDGRQVLDATIGGKLTIFPKVGYDTLF